MLSSDHNEHHNEHGFLPLGLYLMEFYLYNTSQKKVPNRYPQHNKLHWCHIETEGKYLEFYKNLVRAQHFYL